MEEFNPELEYYCSNDISNGKEIKSCGFTYLQYLVINYHNINNCLELIENDIKNNTSDYIDKINNKKYNALILACINSNTCSHIDVVKLLIKLGANINFNIDNKNIVSLTSLYTKTSSSIEVLELILNSGFNINNNSTLMNLCNKSKYHSNKNIKLLIKYGANINYRDSNNLSVLESCLFNIFMDNSKISTLRLLISSGCSINWHSIIFVMSSLNTHIINDDNLKEIYNILLDTLDINDIKKLKSIAGYTRDILINDDNLLLSLFILKILNHHSSLDIAYILSDINQENYDYIINENNMNMKKKSTY